MTKEPSDEKIDDDEADEDEVMETSNNEDVVEETQKQFWDEKSEKWDEEDERAVFMQKETDLFRGESRVR